MAAASRKPIHRLRTAKPTLASCASGRTRLLKLVIPTAAGVLLRTRQERPRPGNMAYGVIASTTNNRARELESIASMDVQRGRARS